MNHGGSMANSTTTGECKIEMIWNWNIIDACFLSSSWHIRNNAMFAASCIGVALLVVCLEFLRRVGKEHDAYLARQFGRHLRLSQAHMASATTTDCCATDLGESESVSQQQRYATYRASPLQQLCRAVIHGCTLGLAYIIMLLAMHYNGYIIISIILGAIIGKFLCDWMVIRIPYENSGTATGEKVGRRSDMDIAGPTGCCA